VSFVDAENGKGAEVETLAFGYRLRRQHDDPQITRKKVEMTSSYCLFRVDSWIVLFWPSSGNQKLSLARKVICRFPPEPPLPPGPKKKIDDVPFDLRK
jgi:hypothetical protein